MSSDRSRTVDPRAVRVSVVGGAETGIPPIVIEPAAVPVGPRPSTAGIAHGNEPGTETLLTEVGAGAEPMTFVDGEPLRVQLARGRDGYSTLLEPDDPDPRRNVVILRHEPADDRPGTTRREVLVDGWAIRVDIESERRASLRERASRGTGQETGGGPLEIRSVIPGRVLSVAVTEGDSVSAGQQLLVIEAMKMQNESRAPRDGVVGRVAVAPGQTIELGDLLVVLG